MRRRYLTALLIAAGVVSVDLLTKRYSAINFADAPRDVIGEFFGLTYTENPGAAFSLFPDGGPILGVAAIVIVVVLLVTLRRETPGTELAAYGLVMGGALGNLADRLFRSDGFLDGKVIDWINLSFIPTFNLADTSITVAVVLLVVDAWRRR